jgi:hypothetical protein
MAAKGSSSTPLATKLEIKPGAQVGLVGSPAGFREALEPLPENVHIHSRPRGRLDVIVFFTTAGGDLVRRFRGLADQLTEAGGLWIAWPKGSASTETNLSFESVQQRGVAEGLVDNKSCSIDEDWQAVRFVRRPADRGDN